MELKDVILSTLAEMDQSKTSAPVQHTDEHASPAEPVPETLQSSEPQDLAPVKDTSPRDITDEVKYLESVKERLLVLFEGFQSPNNAEIEAKIDLTLNFLEYLLSTIDSRLDTLKKRG
jgi:hypothetical protein